MTQPLDAEGLDGLFRPPLAPSALASPLPAAPFETSPLRAPAPPAGPALTETPQAGGGFPATLGFLALGLVLSSLSAWSHFAGKPPPAIDHTQPRTELNSKPAIAAEPQVAALQAVPAVAKPPGDLPAPVPTRPEAPNSPLSSQAPTPPLPQFEPWVLPIPFASIGPTHLPEPPTWLAACPHLEVVGHTCSAGDPAFNEALSIRRAAHVADLLVKRGLLPPTHRGVGATIPRATNTTRAGRIANRRVEVHCLPLSPNPSH